MKVFIIACLAVAALAESDPLFYTAGLPLTTGYINSGIINSGIVSPISPVSYIQPAVEMKKAEEKKVEIEDVKKPIVYSTLPVTTYNTFPSVYGQQIIPQVPLVKVGPSYVAKNGEVEHIVAKREAEADPLMVYSGINTLGYPSVYRTGLLPSVYGAGLVPSVYANTLIGNKATYVNPFTGDVTAKVTNDAITAKNYASKGQYIARAPGTLTTHVAKREAEADPLMVYGSPIVSGLTSPFVRSVYSSAIVNPVVSSQAVASPLLKTLVNPVVNPVVKTFVSSPVMSYAKPLGVEGVENGKTVADDAWQMTPMYAGKGQYIAKSAGATHIAKREADPLTIVRPFNTLGFRTLGYPAVRTFNPYVNTFANRAIIGGQYYL